MARNFSGQTHRNAAGAIQQGEGQACGQLARLFKGAVVVGHKLYGAFVKFIEQQRSDARQTRFGVTHGRSAVTVTRAEVSLAVHQRVTLTEVLRHAHHRVVSGLVAVRMVFTKHVTDDTRTFDWLGTAGAIGPTEAQPHARHAVQNTPLHRLLAVANIGQCASLDDAEGVLKISTLGIRRKAVLVCGLRNDRFGGWGKKIHFEGALGKTCRLKK